MTTDVEIVAITLIEDSLAETSEYRIEYLHKETGFRGRILISMNDIEDKGVDAMVAEDLKRVSPLINKLKKLQKDYIGKTLTL